MPGNSKKNVRQKSGEGEIQPKIICEKCGSAMNQWQCKYICPNCGHISTCSEENIFYD